MPEWKTKTVPLSYPITVGERSFSHIVLREPDVDGLEIIEGLGLKEGVKPTIKQLRGMLRGITGMTEEQVGRIHKDDFETLVEEAVPFVGGEPSSSDKTAGTEPNSTQPQPSSATG